MEGASLVDMIKEGLVAERVATDSYHELIGFTGQPDPTTRRLLKSTLRVEEEHADKLAELLDGVLRTAT